MSLLDGLIAYYPLNETSGTDYAELINGYDGTCNVDIADTHITGKIKGGFSTKQTVTKAIITVNNAENIVGTTEMSIAFWIKEIVGFTWTPGMDFTNYQSGSANRWHFWRQGNVLYFQNYYGTVLAQSVDVSVLLGDGNWHLVVFTWRSSPAPYGYIYIDNVDRTASSLATALPVFTAPSILTMTASDNYDTGIDEILIWDRFLTADDRSNLWNNGDGYSFVKTLEVSSDANGEVITPGEGTFSYLVSENQDVGVSAYVGYVFSHWSGTAVDAGKVADVNEGSTVVTVDGDYTLIANFLVKNSLTITAGAGGSVTEPGEGTFDYPAGTEADIVATPDLNFDFVEWTGSAADAGKVTSIYSRSTTVLMDANYTVHATFLEFADYKWNPSYVFKKEVRFNNLKTEFENGVVQVRQKWPNPKHVFTLVHNNITQAICNEIVGFYTDRAGGFDSFTFIDPEGGGEYVVKFVDDSLITEQIDKGVFNLSVTLEEVL